MRGAGRILVALASVFPPGYAQFNTWLDRSRLPVPPRVTLTVENCPGAPEHTSCTTGTRVWLSPTHRDRRDVFLHEIGHVMDRARMTTRERDLFTRLDGRWDDERFASAYSLCAAYRTLPDSWEVLSAWQPTQAQHTRWCRRLTRWLKP